MAAFISEDFFVEQFRLISQHLVGFHPSAIEHAGHVRIAIVLLFSLWSQVTKDTRIITSKSCEWCQDLVQASPWYQGHGRTKMKVSIAYAAPDPGHVKFMGSSLLRLTIPIHVRKVSRICGKQSKTACIV